jgi:hypothetical protein
MSNEYEEFTIDELEAAISAITLEQSQLKQQKLALHAVLDRKMQAAEAARKLATMSDGEKAVLLQVLQAEGITPSEEFGEI